MEYIPSTYTHIYIYVHVYRYMNIYIYAHRSCEWTWCIPYTHTPDVYNTRFYIEFTLSLWTHVYIDHAKLRVMFNGTVDIGRM
jgi:hypothetical protein